MATKFGLTWWGQRWIGSLEALGAAYENRLPRGRTYARKGTVSGLAVAAGQVTARVQGSRQTPYRVTLRLPTFSDAQWELVIEALAEQVRYAAALLDGRMPEDVDEVLATCGVSLFPQARELGTHCTCPDHANPCKHVAAVHYVLAQTFDADPFLLPTLRGRDRTTLLAGLRAARTGTPAPDQDVAASPDDGVPISTLTAATMFDAYADLAAIPAHPREPDDPTALLRRLGPLPGPASAATELLDHLVCDAAERSWRLASAASEGTDHPLLGELRQRGSASVKDLAVALDRRVDDVRAALRTLVAGGLVHRTGHARSTRYHA